MDAASQQARLAYWPRALATLDSIPFDSLAAEGRINAQVFRATVHRLATQARAYKLGEIQIRRHRREAEAALGTKFDQRTFHDAILALGAVPLPVLEQRMAQFIADGGTNPPR